MTTENSDYKHTATCSKCGKRGLGDAMHVVNDFKSGERRAICHKCYDTPPAPPEEQQVESAVAEMLRALLEDKTTQITKCVVVGLTVEGQVATQHVGMDHVGELLGLMELAKMQFMRGR